MDPFATLGIARSFELDLSAVEKRHRELSRALHPDKYAAAGASERQAALSKAVEVNEAWRVVRDPVRRAEALFALAGVATGEAGEPKPSAEFLMDMLEQREALAEAKERRDAARMRRLADSIAGRARAAEEALATGFADGGNLSALVGRLGELRFYKRFADEVSSIEEALEDNGHGAP
jgi:molecular chaperone HscB